MWSLAQPTVSFESPNSFEGLACYLDITHYVILSHQEAFFKFWYQNRKQIKRKKPLKTRKLKQIYNLMALAVSECNFTCIQEVSCLLMYSYEQDSRLQKVQVVFLGTNRFR